MYSSSFITLFTVYPCNINVTWTIVLSVAGSIIFYFIEKLYNEIFAMPKVVGDDRMQGVSSGEGRKSRKYIRIYNKSRCDAYNTKVHVDFLAQDQQNNAKFIVYGEDREFPYLPKKTGEQLYTLFLNLKKEEKQKKEIIEERQKKEEQQSKEKIEEPEESDIKYILGKSSWMHVIITSQNQFGRVNKTADYHITLSQEDRKF